MRFHLSTCLLVMFVASELIMLNVFPGPRFNENASGSYGFPMIFIKDSSMGSDQTVNRQRLLGDIGAWILFVLPMGIFNELLIREKYSVARGVFAVALFGLLGSFFIADFTSVDFLGVKGEVGILWIFLIVHLIGILGVRLVLKKLGGGRDGR